jgi:hypothetical protein
MSTCVPLVVLRWWLTPRGYNAHCAEEASKCGNANKKNQLHNLVVPGILGAELTERLEGLVEKDT